MKIDVKVNDIIHKPIDYIYKTIILKDSLSKFFITAADSDLIQGKKVKWIWKDQNATAIIDVVKLVKNKEIAFNWSAGGQKTFVRIFLKEVKPKITSIMITETPFELNPKDLKKALSQTQGWTDFVCSLKAFLYAGINLRTGKPVK